MCQATSAEIVAMSAIRRQKSLFIKCPSRHVGRQTSNMPHEARGVWGAISGSLIRPTLNKLFRSELFYNAHDSASMS